MPRVSAAHETSGARPADALRTVIVAGVLVDGKDSLKHLVARTTEILVPIAMNLDVADLDQRLVIIVTGKSMMFTVNPRLELSKRNPSDAFVRDSRWRGLSVVTSWLGRRLPLAE